MPSLTAILGINSTAFHAGLNSAMGGVKKAGKDMGSALGFFAAGKLGMAGGPGAFIRQMADDAINAVGRFKDLSEQFRVSTDTVQLWDVAAKKVGLTAEDVGRGLERIQKAREAAVEKGDVGAFGLFGINMSTLKDVAVQGEDIMRMMQATVASHPITESEAVAAMELMGKGGSKLLSVMSEMQTMGPVNIIQADDLKALDDANKKIEELKRQLTVMAGTVLGNVAGGIDRAGEKAGELAQILVGNVTQAEIDRSKAGETIHEAPQFDLKGRPLTGPKAKLAPVGGPEEVLSFSVTKTVDLNKDLAKETALRAQLADKIAKSSLKEMSDSEKKVALAKQIAAHEKEAISFRFQGDEVKALEEDIKAADLKGELGSMTKKGSKDAFKPDLNALQKIGGLSVSTEAIMAARRQEEGNSTLKQIEKHLARIGSRAPETTAFQ